MVGATTDAVEEGWLGVEHPVVELTVAVNMSLGESVKVFTVQTPLLFAVVGQLAAVGLVLFSIISALASEVPVIEFDVESNLPFKSVLIVGGRL